MIRKILRITLLTLGGFLLFVLLFIVVSLKTVDRTPFSETPHYSAMMDALDAAAHFAPSKPKTAFATGYARVNLTPSLPIATAGYGTRRGEPYTAVHDSIFVRAIVVTNGVEKVAIVSADLLIIPPKVTEVLAERLDEVGFSLNNTYLNATHTHNSIGNWGEGATGFVYGSYSDTIVSFIADKVVECIRLASRELVPSRLRAGHTWVASAVRNRLDKVSGTVDSTLHAIEIIRNDSSRLLITSFNAHATCLYSRDLELSRDYPGALVDELEENGYQFAMFLSGAVGSHGCSPPEFGKPCIGWMADELTNAILELKPRLHPVVDTSLMMVRIPLLLGEAQVKISENWRVRPWLFNTAFGEYQSFLTALRLGDVMLLGTPCDFSGELTAPIRLAATEKGMDAIVTSFNGHYIGYITVDKYYDDPHYETRLMNWYGPGNGAYLTECLIKLQEAVY